MEPPWTEGLHHCPAREDDRVVGDNGHDDLHARRQGRLSLHKLEFLRRVAHHALVDVVKQGPEMDAEGPVHAGHRHLNGRLVHWGSGESVGEASD